MKYNIDKELNSLSMFSGAMVVHLYPLVNIVYRLNNCKSDSFVTVKKYSTPGFWDQNDQLWSLNQNNAMRIYRV